MLGMMKLFLCLACFNCFHRPVGAEIVKSWLKYRKCVVKVVSDLH